MNNCLRLTFSAALLIRVSKLNPHCLTQLFSLFSLLYSFSFLFLYRIHIKLFSFVSRTCRKIPFLYKLWINATLFSQRDAKGQFNSSFPSVPLYDDLIVSVVDDPVSESSLLPDMRRLRKPTGPWTDVLLWFYEELYIPWYSLHQEYCVQSLIYEIDSRLMTEHNACL